MPMRGELPCRAQSRPAVRTKLVAVVAVIAVIMFVVLVSGTIDSGLWSTFTVEELWLLGP